MPAAGLADVNGVKGRAVVRQAAHRDAAAGAILENLRLLPLVEIDFARAERRAEILDHGEGRPARGAFGPFARQADEPLILRLVVPVREKDGEEPQRVHMRTRGAALRRVDAAELVEGPSVHAFRGDRPRVELALEYDPFEVVIVVVVERLFVHRRRCVASTTLAITNGAAGQP